MVAADIDPWLERVYGAEDSTQVRESYDSWARDYERDLMGAGYRNIALASGLVARHVPRGEGPLLDAGCGTGLLGQALSVLGYGDIDGIDLSDGMLREASAKGAYRHLHEMALDGGMALSGGPFRAVISLGVFTKGHAPAACLPALVALIQPGGHLIFTLTAVSRAECGFGDEISALEAAGRIRLVERTMPYLVMPYSSTEGDLESDLNVYQVV